MNKLVFDIETKNIFSDLHTDDPSDLDISVISIYDYVTEKYYSFLEEDFDKMWPFFEKADLLITFNGKHFDIPVLQKYTEKIDLSAKNHLDIFEKIKEVTGKKIGMGGIASETLGESKSANGLEAVAWWNAGEIDKIIKYCEQDVKVTKDIYEYAKNNGHLYYIDFKTNARQEAKLDTKDWEKTQNSNDPLTLF